MNRPAYGSGLALSPHRNFDHEAPHGLIQLEIFPGALGVGVVASHAGWTYGRVGVDGLEVGLISLGDRSGHYLFRMREELFRAGLLRCAPRHIERIDRPEADKPVADRCAGHR